MVASILTEEAQMDPFGAAGAAAFVGICAAWVRIIVQEQFRTSAVLRGIVESGLLLGILAAGYFLIGFFPSLDNPLSWLFGAVLVVGLFLLFATIGEAKVAL
ncbi:MAG TPA: hypothetical protein VHN19_06400 [Burkholderiales bacterium]|nr:hypothetical protein [Burkholderiales bacterium]